MPLSLHTVTKYVGHGLPLLLAVMLAACSKTPSGVVPEQKMRHLLVDMHLAEAMIQSDPVSYETDADRRALFQSVFDKHGLTEAEYDSSLIWYGQHLEIYMNVYDLAMKDLEQRVKEEGATGGMADDDPMAEPSDLWVHEPYYEFTPASPVGLIPIRLSPNFSFTAGNSYTLACRIWGLDGSDSTTITLCIASQTEDTTLLARQQISADGPCSVTLATYPNLFPRPIHGYIRLDRPATSAPARIWIDSLSLTTQAPEEVL